MEPTDFYVDRGSTLGSCGPDRRADPLPAQLLWVRALAGRAWGCKNPTVPAWAWAHPAILRTWREGYEERMNASRAPGARKAYFRRNSW